MSETKCLCVIRPCWNPAFLWNPACPVHLPPRHPSESESRWLAAMAEAWNQYRLSQPEPKEPANG
jgi:hypothetical protein